MPPISKSIPQPVTTVFFYTCTSTSSLYYKAVSRASLFISAWGGILRVILLDWISASYSTNLWLAFTPRSRSRASRATSVQLAMSAVFKPYAGISEITELTEADVPNNTSADAFQNSVESCIYDAKPPNTTESAA